MYPVIGLEVHFQVRTKTKLFSSMLTKLTKTLNSNVNLVDLAYPGVLPVLNERVVFLTLKFGIAIKSTIQCVSCFDRKHYFYPDLPKGYQITQQHNPILKGGFIDITLKGGKKKRIFIEKAHIEEDTGRFLKINTEKKNKFVDYNRAGLALVEVVTKPMLFSVYEVVEYLKELHFLIKCLNICDGNLQDGSFRCDVNVSLRKHINDSFGTKVEIKNVNSFRYVEKAINFEIFRQNNVLKSGLRVKQETRFYLPTENVTKHIRSKENFVEYRYLVDPDLPSLYCTTAFVSNTNLLLGETPNSKLQRFSERYNLKINCVYLLFKTKCFLDYFQLVSLYTDKYVVLFNTMLRDLVRFLKEKKYNIIKCLITPYHFSLIVDEIILKNLSYYDIKKLFIQYWNKKNYISAFFLDEKKCVFFSKNYVFLMEELLNIYYVQHKELKLGKTKIKFFLVGKFLLILNVTLSTITVTNLIDYF